MFGIGSEIGPRGSQQAVIRVKGTKVAVFPHPNDGNVWLATQPQPYGKHFYVDPYAANASDSNEGTSWGSPYKLIQSVHDTLVTSGQGDIIHVKQAHPDADITENAIITKEALTIVPAWETGIGMKVTWAPATGSSLIVRAHSFKCAGFRFKSTTAVGAVVQSSDGFIYEDCDFSCDHGSGFGFRLLPITGSENTASQGIIRSSTFRDNVGVALQAESVLSFGTTDNLFENLRFYNNSGIDIKSVVSAGQQQVMLNSHIKDCQFLDKNKAVYIDLSGGTSNKGLLSNLHFAHSNGATRLANTQVVLATGVIASGIYDAVGLVDASGFHP